jgi:hypothetical protein
MKFYGDANLQQNELQNAVLSTLTQFPSTPKQGQIAFVRSIVYICVTAGELPVWVPLTNEITAYTHNQEGVSANWTINHPLNTMSVNVQVYDGTNNVIIPDSILTTSPSQVLVNFSTPTGGRAVLVTGQFDGNVKPTYAYTHQQTSQSTTWTINHNLGYNPVVRVFIGNDEVQPLTISHPSTMQTVITFTTVQAGFARLI